VYAIESDLVQIVAVIHSKQGDKQSYGLPQLYLPIFMPYLLSFPLFSPITWQGGWQKHRARPD
jgi:hypothetical protein